MIMLESFHYYKVKQFQFVFEIEKMQIMEACPQSFQSISIKLTQNFIPSSNTLARYSQDYVSLTYTVSFQQINDDQTNEEIKQQNTYLNNQQTTIDYLMQKQNAEASKFTDVGRAQKIPTFDIKKSKKSILKINQVELSPQIEANKKVNLINTPQNYKTKRAFQISNHPGSILRFRGFSEYTTSNKISQKSKQREQQFSPENLLLRTNKFYSIKNDQIKQKNAFQSKKGIFTNKQFQKSASTERNQKLPHLKFPLPIINYSSFRKKNGSSHLNVLNEKQINLIGQKLLDPLDSKLIGKNYKMIQNDKKAKVYLQKIIQNRCSIMHLNQQKLKMAFKDQSQNN